MSATGLAAKPRGTDVHAKEHSSQRTSPKVTKASTWPTPDSADEHSELVNGQGGDIRSQIRAQTINRDPNPCSDPGLYLGSGGRI